MKPGESLPLKNVLDPRPPETIETKALPEEHFDWGAIDNPFAPPSRVSHPDTKSWKMKVLNAIYFMMFAATILVWLLK